jgi:hypothetical protein
VTIEELKAALRTVLEQEAQKPVDWHLVEQSCLAVIKRLNSEDEPNYPHHIVYHFLDDANVRRKSDAYASQQRAKLKEWVEETS